MSEYTPTEHEVRLVWTEWSGWGGLTDRPDYDATRTEMRAEFGRFIARVRRDAWDACYRQMVTAPARGVTVTWESNPYAPERRVTQ